VPKIEQLSIPTIALILEYTCENLQSIYRLRRICTRWLETLFRYSPDLWRRIIPITDTKDSWSSIEKIFQQRVETLLPTIIFYKASYCFADYMHLAIKTWHHGAIASLLDVWDDKLRKNEPVEINLYEICVDACKKPIPHEHLKRILDKADNGLIREYDWSIFREVLVSCGKQMVEYLIQRGVDVITNTQHVRPLHYAVFSGDIETVEFLIELGADVNHKWRRYYDTPSPIRTPLMVAIDAEDKEMEAFLRSKGAIDVEPITHEPPQEIDRK